MTWNLVIELEWPRPEPPLDLDFEALIRECVDPLHRENVIVSGVRLEQVPEP